MKHLPTPRIDRSGPVPVVPQHRLRAFIGWFLCVFVAACSSEAGDDGGVLYQKPQILPDNSPVCLNYDPVTVGTALENNILLRNDGRETLVIDSAEFVDTSADVFEIVGIEPKSVESRDSAVVRFRYRPTRAGWDSASLIVRSNAENYKNLAIFVFALAVPPGTDAGPGGQTSFDAGAKPAAAGGACAAEHNQRDR